MNGKDAMHATGECEPAAGLGSRFSANGSGRGSWQIESPGLGPNSPELREGVASGTGRRESLGAPLTIYEVAELLGCSPWTVRQRYLRQGLPYLQARARGKLVFFREQVIAWIEKRQRQKGGLLR